MPTPEPVRRTVAPTDVTVKSSCPICSRDALELAPNAVTVDAQRGEISTRCGHCGHVHTRPVPVRFMALLLGAGADLVPRGIDEDTKALVMAARVYGGDAVPTWPAGGAA